ncbi:MAG TPA: glycosyltransferase family A protein [Hanamia sp.]|jgi:glycosyltransferase involved in cell wall biosynthesis|nr:glycosyltransferase family A protein [Hanamia sp.]
MKKTRPFFSVILTSYNRSALLVRALNSLISQTEKDWEAIIIDDGSTDDTAVRVASFLKFGKKINYVKQNSQGAAGAKNTGILLSKGKYVTFLDSDDEYYPCHLQSRKMILEANPEAGFLHGGIIVSGSKYVPDRWDCRKMIHLKDCSVGGTFFIKRELCISLGGFADITLGHDADFFDRINNAGILKIKTAERTYVYHRENSNSITNKAAAYRKLSAPL